MDPVESVAGLSPASLYITIHLPQDRRTGRPNRRATTTREPDGQIDNLDRGLLWNDADGRQRWYLLQGGCRDPSSQPFHVSTHVSSWGRNPQNKPWVIALLHVCSVHGKHDGVPHLGPQLFNEAGKLAATARDTAQWTMELMRFFLKWVEDVLGCKLPSHVRSMDTKAVLSESSVVAAACRGPSFDSEGPCPIRMSTHHVQLKARVPSRSVAVRRWEIRKEDSTHGFIDLAQLRRRIGTRRSDDVAATTARQDQSKEKSPNTTA